MIGTGERWLIGLGRISGSGKRILSRCWIGAEFILLLVYLISELPLLPVTGIFGQIFFFPGSLFLMDSFPDEIGKCGVNCSLASCYRSGRCKGCGSEDTNQKRISKWKCKIRVCVSEKNLHHCGECQQFPCRLRSSLDTLYLRKYSINLIENVSLLRDMGPDVWLKQQKSSHTCRVCGDMVSPYSRECYGCGRNHP